MVDWTDLCWVVERVEHLVDQRDNEKVDLMVELLVARLKIIEC